jgi:hypothetical protein
VIFSAFYLLYTTFIYELLMYNLRSKARILLKDSDVKFELKIRMLNWNIYEVTSRTNISFQ